MSDQAKGKARRAQVANACISCRSAKLKCSGRHPVCTRCSDKAIKCTYDVSEGMTKREQQRRDLSDQERGLDRAMALLDYMRKGSDHEATEMLARLRSGATFESEYLRVRDLPLLQALQTAEPSPESSSHASKELPDADLVAQNHRLASLIASCPQTQTETQDARPPEAAWSLPQDANFTGMPEGWLGFSDNRWTGNMMDIDPQILQHSQETYSGAFDAAASGHVSDHGGSSRMTASRTYRSPYPPTGGI